MNMYRCYFLAFSKMLSPATAMSRGLITCVVKCWKVCMYPLNITFVHNNINMWYKGLECLWVIARLGYHTHFLVNSPAYIFLTAYSVHATCSTSICHNLFCWKTTACWQNVNTEVKNLPLAKCFFVWTHTKHCLWGKVGMHAHRSCTYHFKVALSTIKFTCNLWRVLVSFCACIYHMQLNVPAWAFSRQFTYTAA